MLSRRNAPPVAVATAVGLGVGVKGYNFIARHYGTAGTPKINMPADPSVSFGYSFSVEMKPPAWGGPVAIMCGLGAAAVVFLLVRRRTPAP